MMAVKKSRPCELGHRRHTRCHREGKAGWTTPQRPGGSFLACPGVYRAQLGTALAQLLRVSSSSTPDSPLSPRLSGISPRPMAMTMASRLRGCPTEQGRAGGTRLHALAFHRPSMTRR